MEGGDWCYYFSCYFCCCCCYGSSGGMILLSCGIDQKRELLLHNKIRSILLYIDFLVLIFVLILVCFCVIDFFF